MASLKGINRREIIKGVAVGLGTVTGLPILEQQVSAQHQHSVPVPLVPDPATRKGPTFFNPHEYATITELSSMIIPTDETPGAREAQVNEYIDMIANEGSESLKKLYRNGLKWLDKTSRSRHGKLFIDLSKDQQVELLTEISHVRHASTNIPLQTKFFRQVKHDTVDGFYTSKIGLDELGYKGNAVLDEFPGCTHPEHQG